MITTNTGLTDQYKIEELRKKLLQCLKESNQQLADAVQVFLDKPARIQTDAITLLQAVIDASDHVLKSDNWDSSLFLRNTIKTVAAIKTEAEKELDLYQKAVKTSVTQSIVIGPDETEVYISLFQSEGSNLEKWAMQLRSLERYVVGRPVYQYKKDVEKRIRLRNALANEAYVIVAVKNSNIQFELSQMQLKDQFDHPLLQIKETALKTGKIIGFVHQGISYYFVNGKLVKQ